MKETYTSPEFEVILLEETNVMTLSGAIPVEPWEVFPGTEEM